MLCVYLLLPHTHHTHPVCVCGHHPRPVCVCVCVCVCGHHWVFCVQSSVGAKLNLIFSAKSR